MKKSYKNVPKRKKPAQKQEKKQRKTQSVTYLFYTFANLKKLFL